MKVYISDYPTNWIRSNIHTKYMNRKYEYDWPETQTKFEDRLESIENGIQWIYNNTINKILQYRKRKIEVRVDSSDIWSADHTLAVIIHPLLVKLREEQSGSPKVDDEDVPENIRSTNAKPKKDWENDEFYHTRWDWVLNEMIWTFDMLKSDDQEWVWIGDPKDVGYEPDKEKTEANRQRINNGLRLFGKYYRGLWS